MFRKVLETLATSVSGEVGVRVSLTQNGLFPRRRLWNGPWNEDVLCGKSKP